MNGTQGMLAIGALAADRPDAARDRRRGRGDDDRGRARNGCAVRLPAPAAPAASRSGGERLEPPPAPRRLADPRVPSGQRAPRAGRVFAPLRAAGARGTRDVLTFARGVLEIELNAVSDNPIVLPDDGDIVSGGNFHGQPVAVAMDALATATVGMASISERRLYRLARPGAVERAPALPRAGERSEQRVHARPVHGGVARLGVEVARASRVGRFDPVLGRTGGPRLDGDDGRAACSRRRRERGGRLGARGSRRRAGAGPPGAARARSRDRARCSRRSAKPCRSSRRTGSSAPTSRLRSSWFDPAGCVAAAETVDGPLD